MTLIVTEHAVERYAERVIGIDPGTLTGKERDAIAKAIRAAVIDPGEAVQNWRVRRSDAIYVVERRAVLTVLLPSFTAAFKTAPKRRQGVHA